MFFNKRKISEKHIAKLISILDIIQYISIPK